VRLVKIDEVGKRLGREPTHITFRDGDFFHGQICPIRTAYR
jgi:hypothetical protein